MWDGNGGSHHTSYPYRSFGVFLYYHPAFHYDYYICKMVPRIPGTNKIDLDGGWVEVWFFTGEYYTNGKYVPPSAFVSDSEGNFYEVDLTLE